MGGLLEQKVSDEKIERWRNTYNLAKPLVISLFNSFYSARVVEGKLPEEGPMLLLPTHQYSTDPLALLSVIPEYVSFVFATRNLWKKLPMRLASSTGGIWVPNTLLPKAGKELVIGGNGLPKKNHYFSLPKEKIVRDSEKLRQQLAYLYSQNSIVVCFAQGDFEDGQVSQLMDGIINRTRKVEHIINKPVKIVPVGMEYIINRHVINSHNKKSYLSVFGKYPPIWAEVLIRYAPPMFLDGKKPIDVLEEAMQTSARLSKLEFNYARKQAYPT
jgi:hypothetical protein